MDREVYSVCDITPPLARGRFAYQRKEAWYTQAFVRVADNYEHAHEFLVAAKALGRLPTLDTEAGRAYECAGEPRLEVGARTLEDVRARYEEKE